jgi:hypothetical protein
MNTAAVVGGTVTIVMTIAAAVEGMAADGTTVAREARPAGPRAAIGTRTTRIVMARGSEEIAIDLLVW